MAIWWCDVINGDDGTGDGSYGNPYKTPNGLLAAVGSGNDDEIRVMDTTERAQKLQSKFGNGLREMWDDELEYISRFGRLIDEFSVKLSTKTKGTEFIIKIAIPNNKLIQFKLSQNIKIGIRIYFKQISTPLREHWATVFEHHSFFNFTLK